MASVMASMPSEKPTVVIFVHVERFITNISRRINLLQIGRFLKTEAMYITDLYFIKNTFQELLL